MQESSSRFHHRTCRLPKLLETGQMRFAQLVLVSDGRRANDRSLAGAGRPDSTSTGPSVVLTERKRMRTVRKFSTSKTERNSRRL